MRIFSRNLIKYREYNPDNPHKVELNGKLYVEIPPIESNITKLYGRQYERHLSYQISDNTNKLINKITKIPFLVTIIATVVSKVIYGNTKVSIIIGIGGIILSLVVAFSLAIWDIKKNSTKPIYDESSEYLVIDRRIYKAIK